jgi:hypothetical protein
MSGAETYKDGRLAVGSFRGDPGLTGMASGTRHLLRLPIDPKTRLVKGPWGLRLPTGILMDRANQIHAVLILTGVEGFPRAIAHIHQLFGR